MSDADAFPMHEPFAHPSLLGEVKVTISVETRRV
jgi:hypothetical protein